MHPVQIADRMPPFNKDMHIADVSLKLSEALEVAFIQGNKISKSALGKMLVGLLNLNGDGFLATKTRLLLIAKHLQEVKNFDKAVWKKLRGKIFNDVDIKHFYGTRFELSIAASLARRNVCFIFNQKDLPDFVLNNDNAGLRIECGSCFLTTAKDKSSYKIESLLFEKNKKQYANTATTLFIDRTNLWSQSKNVLEFGGEEFYSRMQELILKSAYGNVTIFDTYYDIKSQSIHSNYTRFDSERISIELKDFLDVHFPKGDAEVNLDDILVYMCN